MNAAIHGHGRGQEREADKIGIEYMVKAGYDPREGPITFELPAEGARRPVAPGELLLRQPSDQSGSLRDADRAREEQVRARRQEKRLVVNSEEFKRVTRWVVIATGRLDYEQQRFNTAQAMFEKAMRAWQDDPAPALLPRQDRARDRRRRWRGPRAGASRGRDQGRRRLRARAPRAGPRAVPKGRPRRGHRQPRALPRVRSEAEDAEQIERRSPRLKRFSR